MITSTQLATEVSTAGERLIEKLSKCLIEAKSSCSPEEYEQFKKAVASVIGTLEIEMLWPLYRKHPELEPENLRDWKKPNHSLHATPNGAREFGRWASLEKPRL